MIILERLAKASAKGMNPTFRVRCPQCGESYITTGNVTHLHVQLRCRACSNALMRSLRRCEGSGAYLPPRRPKKSYRCGECSAFGHNIRTCPAARREGGAT